MQTLARFVVRHRWYVIGAWIAVIVALQALAGAAGGSTYKDVFTLPHTETQKVLDLLRANGQAGHTGQVGTVVVHARTGTLDATRAPDGLLATLRGLCGDGLHVATVTSPWGAVDCTGAATQSPSQSQQPGEAPARSPLLSADGTTALVTIAWQGNENAVENFTGVHDRLAKLDSRQVQYEFTGDAFNNLAAKPKGVPPEVFGFIAALIILAFVFRSLGATVLPLLSAAAALGGGLALIALLSHVINIATFAPQLASLMVIGVGVDYALFIVTRFRRNLQRGMTITDAVAVAVDTSGRAVLFAGLTVCVAILGLCALGVSFLYGVAVGTSIAVGLTMIASLTLLPAVLSLLGYRALPRKLRQQVKDGSYVHDEHATRWAWWSQFISEHKAITGTLAAALIAVLAIPFFSMRLGHADQSNDPKGTTTRTGYELVTAKFGTGYNSALELVLSGPTAAEPDYLQRVAGALAKERGVDPATVMPTPIGQRLTIVAFKATTSPQDPKTTALVKRLRTDLAPTLESGTQNQVYVFGQTAVFIDFTKILSSKMTLFFVAVIGLSFLLLMVAFRSLVVPLTAAVMNLFAAGASFGIIVAIFQWGWFSEAMGIGKGGPIEAFLPVMFFAILFGLSMDYQVFLVSRMHEEWIHTGDNKRAIRVGQAETGGIITAAALIMIAVFGGFVLGDARPIKLVGVGLGGAIFLDAFVLRTVLVPSLMHALGRSNWYFPKWLDRITPRLSVEPPDEPLTPPDAPDTPGKELAQV